MKRLTGIFLLVLHLLAFTECRQLLRLPYLMTHLREHQNMDPGMTFAGFIRVHYLSPLTITDDFKQDEQLPFRSVDGTMLNTTVFKYEPVSYSIMPPETPPFSFFHFNQKNKPQYSSIAIFQPPRLVVEI